MYCAKETSLKFQKVAKEKYLLEEKIKELESKKFLIHYKTKTQPSLSYAIKLNKSELEENFIQGVQLENEKLKIEKENLQYQVESYKRGTKKTTEMFHKYEMEIASLQEKIKLLELPSTKE